MKHEYKTAHVCSTKITFELDGDIVRDVVFAGGCSGNLKAISILTEGMTVGELTDKLAGNTCGGKKTSCADQLAWAVKQAYLKKNDKEMRNNIIV
ncbi:MAG: TIGR03905 family TSCPD domain-containing protein [Eubacteriales bacterium]|nr:TIGR03905 family TSCPD domain-containing protein [Eubacteriales bacterium]